MDEKIARFLKTHMPASLALKMIRYILTLRPSLVKLFINGMTQPLRSQKRYIHRIHNKYWEGAIIMPEVSTCDDETAIKRLKSADIVIFNVHGGAFRTGHCTMYMDSYIRWIELMKEKYNLNASIMSVKYDLAPESVYPRPLVQLSKAYNHLIQDLNVSPSKIILCGDSAGGELMLELLIRTYVTPLLNNLTAQRSNFEMGLPAGILLSSPLVSSIDITMSWHLYKDTDIVSRRLRQYVFDEYIFRSGLEIEQLELLRLHTVTEKFDRFLPKHILVFVGTFESMRDDILALTENIKRDGACNVTVVQEEFAHDWFLIHDIVGKEKMHLIEKYNEKFVDFAVHAVNEYKDEHVDILDVKETETTVAVDEEEEDYTEYAYTEPKRKSNKQSSWSFFSMFDIRRLPFLSDYFFG